MAAIFFTDPNHFFKLNLRIQETNVLTKFYKVWTKMCLLDCSHKTAPPPGGHVLSLIKTIFKLIRDIHITKLFYYINIKKKTAFPCGHILLPIQIIFKLNCRIQETNLLTKFHEELSKNLNEDWASNVTSTVFTSFDVSRGIIRTNVLTKFHEDRTINFASRVFTRQNVDDQRRTTDDIQKAITKNSP
ncbi:hypothetical protein DPMN_132275 [Dreissena polymorpha]|uniref:Uncharacterized protein n=1 Tax=Dreissena polymorpha TaxID=45954 RepID=A0A9D4FY06_DREPO|nr:hypothetical protein DPMN_132275 [Dreissena polymorpha]